MKIKKLENLHILLWLIKDLCWVTFSEIIGVIMIIPTVFLACYIAWEGRLDKANLFLNLAVCCWILANSVWMLGEFYYNDDTRNIAAVFFIAGLLFIVYYYLFILQKEKDSTN